MADDINSLLRRLDAVERNQTDNAKSLTAVVDNAHAIELRVKAIEAIQFERRIDDERRNAREEAMQKDITSIKSDISSIKGAFTKALWIAGGTVLAAFVAWALRGGPLGG